MSALLKRLTELFSPKRITEFLVNDVLPDLLVAVLVLAFFYVLWRILSGAVRAATKRTAVDETARAFLQAVLKYAVMSVGVVTALAQLGVDTGSVLASLGMVGLTIGFAARDALSNVISGIFIFWDRPFVVGDLIETGSHYGRVAEITMRSTRVITSDGRMLAIPNTAMVNTAVASYTNFPHLRLDVDVGVGVQEDLGRVRRILLDVVQADDRFLSDPSPKVLVTALGDYNVTLQLQAWLADERQHIAVRNELRERCFDKLRTEGVDMPFETLRLTSLEPSGAKATPA